MSTWVEYEFADRMTCVYPRYRKVSASPFKINCRCQVCGDSAKDEFKARFWVYEHKGVLMVKCFNCDLSMSFVRYLKENDQTLYREFLIERRKAEGGIFKADKPIIKEEKIETKGIELINCDRLDKLPINHPIVKYVKRRAIPEAAFSRLYFTTKWPALCNSVKPGTYKYELDEPRLVIPIFTKEGIIESFQGRALDLNAPQKYITIKSHDDATKIYGLDTVKPGRPICVFEGPIDSLFIPNSLAITGGAIELSAMPFKDDRIWVLDNEPRHKDTISRMEKLIEQGETICMWDQAPWKSKDINDMITKEGAISEQIYDYIINNAFSGLRAKQRMLRYKRI